MANGPQYNQRCRRLGFQHGHPFKGPINRQSSDLTIIQENLKRKFVRGPENRGLITEDGIFPEGADYFKPKPTTGVIRIPLSSSSQIYTAGFCTSGSTANIGTFVASTLDGGTCYRVDEDDQGIFIRNPASTLPADDGEFSVWLNGRGSGSGTYNYILSVNENLVMRWESGSQELRLYPDLTNFPSDYVGIPWTSVEWNSGDATWHRYKIKWSYEEQDWRLFIDATEGARTGASQIPHPGWTALMNVSVFSDLQNENNVYHDCAFVSFGERSPAPSGSGVNDHELLSSPHTDTVAADVIRGDLVVGNSTPAWTRLPKGSIGQTFRMIDANDPGWDTLDYTDVKRTECVSYVDVQAIGTATILPARNWTNETVTVFADQPAHPRILSVSSTLCIGGTSVGTVTVSGTDADGAPISEIFTINDAVPTTHYGVKAFRLISSVVVLRSDATIGNKYSVGLASGFGLPNYPFNATTDVFAISKNGLNSLLTSWTINATYGTVDPGLLGVSAGDDFTMFYRPFK